MKIHLSRSGGFTGIPTYAELDTDELDPDEAREIRDALSKAGFFELPGSLPEQQSGADRFTYELTVEEGAAYHSVRMPESSVPAELQPLLPELIRKHRRRQPDR